jgi:hypothetical protein
MLPIFPSGLRGFLYRNDSWIAGDAVHFTAGRPSQREMVRECHQAATGNADRKISRRSAGGVAFRQVAGNYAGLENIPTLDPGFGG